MNSQFRPQYLTAALIMIAFLSFGLTGCSDDPSNPNGSQGDIKMYMVDSPGDYDQVNIVVTEVSVHMSSGDSLSGWMVISDSTRTINLLHLTNGNFDILGTSRLDVGHYSQIRLKIGTGSNVVVLGQSHPLEIPSGSQTGIKLNHQFDIQADVLYELTLDFDASKSIEVLGNGRYQMKPKIRVIANLASGSISGVVSPAAAYAHVSMMIGSDTLTTYCEMMSGGFRLMALPSGMYNVTIEAGVDLYADSTISGVMVTAGQNTSLGTVVLRQR